MRFTLKQLFSVVDGRLSTHMTDVYEILNFVTGKDLYTHQLPNALGKLKDFEPDWFKETEILINKIKSEVGNDFQTIMKYIDENYNNYLIEIFPLKTN